MKKLILTGTVILALAGAGLQSARAGDREWATVGKVLTGVAVAGLIVAASDGHAQCSVTYSAPAYCPPCPPAVPCQYYYCPPPAPVVYCPAPAPVIYCPSPVVVRPPVVLYPTPMAYNHPNKWMHRERWQEVPAR